MLARDADGRVAAGIRHVETFEPDARTAQRLIATADGK